MSWRLGFCWTGSLSRMKRAQRLPSSGAKTAFDLGKPLQSNKTAYEQTLTPVEDGRRHLSDEAERSFSAPRISYGVPVGTRRTPDVVTVPSRIGLELCTPVQAISTLSFPMVHAVGKLINITERHCTYAIRPAILTEPRPMPVITCATKASAGGVMSHSQPGPVSGAARSASLSRLSMI